MIPDSRHMALTILVYSETNKVVLDESLLKFSQNLGKLSKKDRALANSIIFGTLRFKAKLDWIITPFSNKKIKELDAIVIWAIRIALFQIMFMDKIPVSAAVNTAVNIVKAEAGKGAANFSNAVLRKVSKQYSKVKLPDKIKDPALFLSVDKSLPLWLAPIQTRIIPVSQGLLDEAIQMSHELNEKGVRTDIDDRDETLAKRIRAAEKKWIPYIIVMGERELKKRVFSTE